MPCSSACTLLLLLAVSGLQTAFSSPLPNAAGPVASLQAPKECLCCTWHILCSSLPAHDATSQRTLLQSNSGPPSANTTTNTTTKSSKQPHKSLTPVSRFDVAIFVVAGIVLFISAGAGMGGGPVLVPAYLTLGAFHQQAAVALSNCTILAGSVANVLCNARKRHPFKDKPLVDWDLILLMEPPTLLGAIAGSYINKVLPGWISHLLLALLLTLMTVRVLQRAYMIYRRESAAHSPPATPNKSTAAATAAANDCQERQQSQQQLDNALRHPNHKTDYLASGCCSGGNSSSSSCRSSDNRVEGKADCCVGSASSSRMSSYGGADGTVQLVAVQQQQQRGSAQPEQNSSSPKADKRYENGGCGDDDERQQQQQQQQQQKSAKVLHCQVAQQQQQADSKTDAAGPARAAAAAATASPARSRPAGITVERMPSSMLLGIELEGNISDDKLAMLLQETRAGSSSSSQGLTSNGSNGVASLLQQQQQQQQVDAGLPPSEAECRLAYAPPSHTRRNSWEVQDEDWEDADGGDGTASDGAGPGTTSASPQIAAATSAAAVTAVGGHDDSIAAADASVECAAASSNSSSSDSSSSPDAHAYVAAAAVTAVRSTRPAATASKKQTQQQQPPEVAAQSEAVQAMLAAESAFLPPVPVALLVALFLSVLLTSLFSKNAGCGTLGYWLAQWAVAPVLFVLWWFSRRRVLAKVALKRTAQHDFHGDVRWTNRNSVAFPAICSLAGVIAGMFGLGGAVVKTPLLLELGTHPQVTAATTQTMLLLTSAASTIVYAQLGDIPWDYAAVIMPLAFAATLAGQAAIDWLVRRLGRSSIVVMVLAAFFCVACGCTYYVAAVSVKEAAADVAAATTPGKICSSS